MGGPVAPQAPDQPLTGQGFQFAALVGGELQPGVPVTKCGEQVVRLRPGRPGTGLRNRRGGFEGAGGGGTGRRRVHPPRHQVTDRGDHRSHLHGDTWLRATAPLGPATPGSAVS